MALFLHADIPDITLAIQGLENVRKSNGVKYKNKTCVGKLLIIIRLLHKKATMRRRLITDPTHVCIMQGHCPAPCRNIGVGDHL